MALICRVIPVLTALWSCAIPSADPVCIVGAGPAGLTIANRLQAKGYDTVIFEKNVAVGGKCQAFYDDQCVICDTADEMRRAHG